MARPVAAWAGACALLGLAACAELPYADRPGVDPGAEARVPSPEPLPRALPPPVYAARPGAAAPMPAGGPSLYFYPQLGQDEARQDRDRYECYRWAVGQTGTDPGMKPVRELPPPVRRSSAPGGAEVAGGAVAGAVVGSVMASPRHVGEGAVLGAIFGALIGATAQDARQRADAQADARDAARAQRAQRPLDDFRRAMSACMEGRGYRVR